MKQSKTNHSEAPLGRQCQNHWSGFLPAKCLKEKARTNKQAKIKMPNKLYNWMLPPLHSQMLSWCLIPSLDKRSCQGLFQCSLL